ncbi:alkaline-phosphatase-like protein [Zychaea mexicana]|uniref:alkaline-phosphatase-like protein n=1 Tax=Zychaea mexicana TaxID=64656 RepID=UPI0022FEF0D8|nr:alkaline-phosphatase-like protein [Zychaea mexicana]KAI9497358.1 alkaline-phosphatase-like protein [Zychaea mexicana]
MKSAGLYKIASLALICSSALASALRPESYRLFPDPEGQYPRLGACPDDHSCIFPPDLSQFLPGSYFDLRVELHAYDKNTSNPAPEAYSNFKTTVRKDGGKWRDVDDFFDYEETPALDNWNFEWVDSIETSLSEDAKPVDVAVTSRIWRKLKFDKPGTYDVSVQYGPKEGYTVRYTVIEKKAKNAILFIADGCNVGMITAARALARKHTSGKYHDLLSFEKFDNLGHVITHSVDGLVTDSANSASSYATGHKGSVSALGVYADSSADPFDDPKVELITELIRRRQPGKAVGVVSTAAGQDATPAAFYTHTRERGQMAHIVDQIVHGVPDWVDAVAPDVWLAGGAEYFKGEDAMNGTDYYSLMEDKFGYQVVMNKKDLNKYNGDDKLLGAFRTGNLDVWMERNIFVNNTVGNGAAPDLSGNDALGSDQPGLEDMTIKALEVLKKRGGKDGFFLMSEAASVDKQLHPLDFSRAWADLIEMDVTIGKTVEWLKKNGEYEDTLILFTSDHSHAFDVYGSVDQKYMAEHFSNKDMRDSIGLYAASGWPGYFDNDNDGFPDSWTPAITLAAGTNNFPDHYEAFTLATTPRSPASRDPHGAYVGNKEDSAGKYGKGLVMNGNLPVTSGQGVHSMADVFIYSNGPGSDSFKKTIENWNVFYGLTEALDLQRPTKDEKKHKHKHDK